MKSFLTASAIALFGLLTLAPVASARPPRIIIRGGFGFGYPVWVSPYWGPDYIYTYPVPVSYTGELKIKAPMPGASIYIEWGFRGCDRQGQEHSASGGYPRSPATRS